MNNTRERLSKAQQRKLADESSLDARVKLRYKTRAEEEKAIHAAATKSMIDYAQDSDSMKIAVALASALDIVAMRNESSNECQLLVWSPNDGYHVDIQHNINDLSLMAMQIIKTKQDLARISSLVITILSTRVKPFSDEVDTYRERPQSVVLLKDGAFDCKSDEYLDENETQLYHFTYKMNLSRKQSQDMLHVKILDRIFDDWSGGDADKRQLMLDYLRCVLEGDNKGKALAIYGQGGNGKSAYITLASRFLKESSVMRLNIHDAENGFMLEDLSAETVLITGDELRSNYMFGGESMARYKQIIDNQPIKINPKGRAPYTVISHACIIQSMNTPMRFAESNDANRDRWIYIIWGTKNFRRALDDNEVDFDLDLLLNDESFIISAYNYVLDNTEYFKRIKVPAMVSQDSSDLIDNSDNVKLFVDEMEENHIIGHDAILAKSFLYQAFVKWLKEESPSAKPMSQRVFTTRITEMMEARGYEDSAHSADRAVAMRLTSIGLLRWDRFNSANVTGLPFDDEEFVASYKMSRYFIKPDLVPDENRMQSVRDAVNYNQDIDLNDLVNVKILRHLVYEGNNMLAISKYKQILDRL